MTEDFDLKHLREHFGLTQAEMAEILEVSQSTVNAYENNPTSMPIDKFILLSEGLKIEVTDLLGGYKSEKKYSVNFRMDKDVLEERKQIVHIFSEAEKKLNQFKNDNKKYQGYEYFKEACKQASSILKQAQKDSTKENVAFLGKSDTGKSTMINHLLGTEITPAHYQPATSSIIRIVHVDDKPSFLSDEDHVLIYKTPLKDGYLQDEEIYDHDFYKKYKLATGDYSIISNYGLSKNYGEDSEDSIITIYAFHDAEILKYINILDTPGISTGEHGQGQKDTATSEYASEQADVFVYLSVANQFLHTEDHLYLKSIFDHSKSALANPEDPFADIFIVASQAHIINDPKELTQEGGILNIAAERYFKTLPQSYINKYGNNFNVNKLRENMYTYSTNEPALYEDFIKSFERKIQTMIANRNIQAKNTLEMIRNEFIKNQELMIQNFENLIADEQFRETKYQEHLAKESGLKSALEKSKYELVKKIGRLEKQSEVEIKDAFSKILNQEYIIDLINEKGFKNRKRDKEELATLLSNDIGESFIQILTENTEEFNEYVYEEIEAINIDFEGDMFNIQRSFASAIMGLSASGALALYMGTLGNLGGYILVTKAVGVLSSLGISVGGGAAATTFISAIGGPVTIVIGIGLLASFIGGQIFGGGWKKSISKFLIKQFKNDSEFKEYLKKSKKHWIDTEKAVIVSLDQTMEDYYKTLRDLEQQQNELYYKKEIELIKKCIDILKSIDL